MKILVLGVALASLSAGAVIGNGAAEQSPDQTLYVNQAPRSAAVAIWFGEGKSDGFVNLDYGRPTWNDDYDKQLESGKLDGRRWRMGNNFWTQLDTNLTLRFGEVEVPPGQYYVVMERSSEGVFTTHFLDPNPIRKSKMIPTDAEKTTGGIAVEMMHEQADQKTAEFTIAFEIQDQKTGRADLVVSWGNHKITAPCSMKP